MPHLAVVERDYPNLYNQFISLGPLARKNGMGAHGVKYGIEDFYDSVVDSVPSRGRMEWSEISVVEESRARRGLILLFAPETNGELAYRAYQFVERGQDCHCDLAEKNRNARTSYKDLQAQPRRLLNSPIWSGLTSDGRPIQRSPTTTNDWCRGALSLAGSSFYLDQEGYIAFGENLPTYKPSPCRRITAT